MTKYSHYLSEDGFAIFLFHGVIKKNTHPIRNYTCKHITEDRFTEVLTDLITHGTPISMPDIAAAHAEGSHLPPGSFAITFDDGFHNNYSIVAPILKKMGIPATFYLTTSFIETNSSSWIDLIEYAAEKRERFSLNLPSYGLTGSYATYKEKVHLLNSIREVIKTQKDVDPYQFADDFCRAAGVTEFIPDLELDQKMTWDQVRELSKVPLFTIGGHGHTHRILAYLAGKDLEYEIKVCVRCLKSRIGEEILHFSYPEGQAYCYSDQVISMLHRCGIICSPTAEPGMNHPRESLFRLKRITVV